MSFKTVLKFAISAVMLSLVYSLVDFEALKSTLINIPISYLLIMFVGYCCGQIISAYKWMLIAQSGDIQVNFIQAIKAYFLGMYVNTFGLGLIGGDVTRGLLISAKQGKKTLGLASVVADRAHGLVILCLIAVLSIAILNTANIDQKLQVTLYLVAAIIIFAWFYGPQILLKLLPKDKAPKLRIVANDIQLVFPKKIFKIIEISFLSACFHFSQIGLHWVMAQALEVNIPFSYLLVVIPFINVATSLPISWQGLGVRESAYTYFFVVTNYINNEQAVAFGAIWFFSATCASAVGGVVATLSPKWKEIK